MCWNTQDMTRNYVNCIEKQNTEIKLHKKKKSYYLGVGLFKLPSTLFISQTLRARSKQFENAWKTFHEESKEEEKFDFTLLKIENFWIVGSILVLYIMKMVRDIKMYRHFFEENGHKQSTHKK